MAHPWVLHQTTAGLDQSSHGTLMQAPLTTSFLAFTFHLALLTFLPRQTGSRMRWQKQLGAVTCGLPLKFHFNIFILNLTNTNKVGISTKVEEAAPLCPAQHPVRNKGGLSNRLTAGFFV